MAKARTKRTSTTKKSQQPKFCWNCGQRVAGAIAERAAILGVVSCCECGFQVNQQGNCPNQGCPFFGVHPQC
jgi:hypothetical protein